MAAKRALVPVKSLKFLDRFTQRPAVSLIKEDAGRSFLDGFDRAAATVGDNRSAGSVGFQRSHAKVFLAGKQQRATSRGIIVDDLVRLTAKKFDAVVGECFQSRAIGTITNHN